MFRIIAPWSLCSDSQKDMLTEARLLLAKMPVGLRALFLVVISASSVWPLWART